MSYFNYMRRPRSRTVSDSAGGGGNAIVPHAADLYQYSNKAWRGSNTSINSRADSDGDFSFGRFDIHQAARLGNQDWCETLLANKHVVKNINDLDESGMAPLHYAARFNQYDIVTMLVEKAGADPNVPDKTKATPLHYAARKKESVLTDEAVNIITYLADRGNVNAQDKYMSTPLHFAAMRGNEVVTTTLLENKEILIDSKDEYGATPLHEAVIYNHLAVVKMLIEHGAEVFMLDKERISPLHLAAMEGSKEMTDMLLDSVKEEKMDDFVNATDKEGNTALHLAVEGKNEDVVELLISHDADVNLKCRLNTNGSTPLHLAATARDLVIAKMLLQSGANINEGDIFKASPIHKAAEYGGEEVAKLFLEQDGIDVNMKDDELYTPLLTACCYNNPEMVRNLLAHKADITDTELQEKTAINLAATHDQPAVMKVLLKHISKGNKKYLVNQSDRFGNTPLHSAATMGHMKIVKMLLQCKAEVETRNEEEETPFHQAAMNGQTDVCRILLDETDCHVLNDEDEDSNTALHLATKAGHLDTVKLLIANGADKESRNCMSWTPLDFAASEGHLEIVKHLLNEDVPVNPIDREQTTPLHLASRNGHVEVVDLLLKQGADVSQRDKQGRNALDMAILRGHTDVANVIVQSPVWWRAMLNDTYNRNSKTKITPLRSMIKKTPEVAIEVLDRCIETGPENVDEMSPDFYIQFNFDMLDDSFSKWEKTGIENEFFQEELFERTHVDAPRVKEKARVYCDSSTQLKNNHPIMLISRYNQDNLMFHPVTRALLRRKWNIASIFYVCFLLFYVVFLSMLTSFMVTATPPFEVNFTICSSDSATGLKSNFEQLVTVVIYALSAFGLALEAFQFFVVKSKYLELNNLLDWFTYISSILVVVDFTSCGARTSWQWQLGAFSLLFAWLNMLLFLRRLPWLGIYVIMVVEIFKTFLKFFVVFFLFILAFAICFFVLLQNQDAFRTPFYSIIKTWVMMIGEMDFGDIFHGNVGEDDPSVQLYFEGSTYAIYIMFLVLIALIVMNLLTGLAVDDVNQLQNVSRLKKLTMQLELALDVEAAMPYWVQRLVGCVVKYERVYPNKHHFELYKIMRRFMEGPLSIEKLCDEVLGRHMEEDRDEEIRDLEEKITKKLDKHKVHMKTMHSKVNNIENMLQQLLSMSKKTHSSKRGGRSQLVDGANETDADA